MSMATMIERHCPACATLEPFEQPPCFDGHGAGCPEWLCLTCGAALLIDMPVEPSEQLVRPFSSRAA
ncbi:MAG TPA: hypothetical protein VIY28_10725 [Pseudonocardiaceae bacterium]